MLAVPCFLLPPVPHDISHSLPAPLAAAPLPDAGASFALGTLVGAFMSFASLFLVLQRFLRNLQRGDLDGAKWGSFGGLVMPSFFFEGAQEIFRNVRRSTMEAQQAFQESGRFEDIYISIEEAQKEQVLQGLEALKERFPRSKSRERIFQRIAGFVRENRRFAASIYDLTVRLQPGGVPEMVEICSELWLLDENRCTVSGRQVGEGLRPWVNASAQILIDTQVPASRLTDASMAHRPLFAYVAPEVLAKPSWLCLLKLFDIFQHLDHSKAFSEQEEEAIEEFIKVVARTAVMRRAFRYAVDTLKLDLDGFEGEESRSWQKEIKNIWFTRKGRPCAFEHIFVGNLSEGSDGHPVAGGLHCWLKFYLEELRGTAEYLGYFYNRNPKEALKDHRYISGKFTWKHAGRSLVKEGGGFFVGVSPEWLLADGTIAYLETRDPVRAQAFGWQTWLGARDKGYTKDVVHEGFRYRKAGSFIMFYSLLKYVEVKKEWCRWCATASMPWSRPLAPSWEWSMMKRPIRPSWTAAYQRASWPKSCRRCWSPKAFRAGRTRPCAPTACAFAPRGTAIAWGRRCGRCAASSPSPWRRP